jgi:hypothetical protein
VFEALLEIAVAALFSYISWYIGHRHGVSTSRLRFLERRDKEADIRKLCEETFLLDAMRDGLSKVAPDIDDRLKAEVAELARKAGAGLFVVPGGASKETEV